MGQLAVGDTVIYGREECEFLGMIYQDIAMVLSRWGDRIYYVRIDCLKRKETISE